MPECTEQQIINLHYALEQADGRAFDLNMLLLAERHRVRELEALLTEERHLLAVYEHALAGLSWTLAEGGDGS